MSRHVAVLMGGWSAERDVSLSSGSEAVKALREAGYRVTPVDVGKDLGALASALTPRPDVVFNALHGRGGEDGTIQAVLEVMGLPYTHSGVLASAVGMDKPMTKQLLATVGVPSPQGLVVQPADFARGHPLPPPYVAKPANEGSTVGVVLVSAGSNGPDAVGTWAADDRIVVEEFIPGRELTVGVMGDRALGVTQIESDRTVFDYEAKYTAGVARHRLPAPIPDAVTDAALRLALLAHRTLGCRGVTRSDFRYDDRRHGPDGLFFLEINTQPGLTPVSLVPEQAAHVGISYRDLCAWMVEDALCRA